MTNQSAQIIADMANAAEAAIGMTRARRSALQWFYDRGAVVKELSQKTAPSAVMMNKMERDGQLELTIEGWALTDKGRMDLWESR